MKILRKLATIVIVLIQILLLANSVRAAKLNENKSLERAEKGYYCVQKWDGSKWVYLTYNRTYYTDTDGQKYIAYCLSPGLPGVGYVSGEKETYQVKIKELMNNDVVWRIMKNGYPYKTIQELGLETADDAYFATMQAINCVLRGYSLEQAKELYSPGQFAINGEKFEDIQRRGKKTLNVMFNLIDIGLNGKETRNQLLNISIKAITNFNKENDDFYSQTFKVQSSSEISQYNVIKIENLPEGSYVSDTNGNKKQNFKSGENFKIMIPKNKILNNINGKITISVEQKNYPIYYGSTMLEGYQDYALCNTPYSEVYTTSEVYVQTNKSKLIITKLDKDTQKPIQGVKFKITGSNGITNTLSTDVNGKITLANQNPGTVTIKEIEAAEKYVLNENEVKVNLEYGEIKEVKIENELKKGNIKIVKMDKENNNTKLENVKFQLKNEQGKVVKEGITDKNGELVFKNLLIGKYTLLETQTPENYVLNEKEIEVEVEYNKTKLVEVENELKKGSIKIIKIDKEDNNIKLENVKFQLKNEIGEVVKEGLTNQNGELIFEDLLIGKYILLETQTPENYVLNEKVIEVEVEYNKTKLVEVENELKKGSIKIIKIDKEDNNIKLENVKFQLKNEIGEVVKEGLTNQNGELIFDDLVIGKYKVLEVDTVKNYVLNEKEIDVEVEYNKTKEIKVQNELKKGNVKIIKIDSDDNTVKLSGVRFQIKNKLNEVIKEGITDNNGELLFEDLEIGKYKLLETETLEKYKLNEKEIEIEVEYNKTKNIEVKNNIKKGSIKITKIDKEDSNIKLENVVFRLLDEENNIIKEGVTNKEGELIFANILIGTYKIVEIETNENYNLLEKKIDIQVNCDEITEIAIENEKVKEVEKIEKSEEIEQIDKIEIQMVELPKTGNIKKTKYVLFMIYIFFSIYNLLKITKK